MQESITLNVSPFQAILALAFQIWIVIFPILLIRKIDRLTAIVEDHIIGTTDEAEDQGPQNTNEGA